MAEAVISLIGSITCVLAQEVLFLREVPGELNEIKDELESMQSFLKEADRRKESDQGFRTWKDQVRDVAYDAEDMIDEYVYRTRKRRGFTGFLYNVIFLPKAIIRRHRFRYQLQAIKAKVIAISERKNRYAFDKIEEGSSLNEDGESWRQRYGESSLFDEEDDIVGIEQGRDFLVRWLTDEEQQQRTIISVVGIGGLGKTTMVSRAYKNQVVRKHFNCQGWVSVSQSYRIEELLKCIIKEVYQKMLVTVPNDLDAMSYRGLVETLNSFLQQKRYVIVLDDIWSSDVWRELSAAFPDCRCGSRIMVTTRKVDVSSSLGNRSRVYHLKPLDPDSTWTLFCKKAFWSEPSNTCPDELLPLAKTIVEKCDGLPLAIVALGGVVSSRDKTVLEWKKLEDSLSWELNNNSSLEPLRRILLLSFNDLPQYLRSCFLYCSAYPEDYLIQKNRLLRQWIAEGLVDEIRGLTLEEVAEMYLKELASRSMLQVREKYSGKAEILVHDLLRELALQVAEQEKIFVVYDGRNTSFNMKARRLSIHRSDRSMNWSMSTLPFRTFLLFDKDTNYFMLSRFKLLRALDLEGSSITTLPDELVNLFNLRYLSLKWCKEVRELPKSFEQLQNLQTLDVRYTMVKALPSGLRKLPRLRHLLVGGNYIHCSPDISTVRAPKGVCDLGSTLQCLDCIEGDGDFIEEVANLIALRRFGITNVQATDGTKLCTAIQKMSRLRHLLVVAGEDEVLRLESLSPSPTFLQKLRLSGRLEKLPHWLGSLLNLTHLSLSLSRLTKDPVSSLCELPNLVFLYLHNAFVGERLHFCGGGFPRLRVLWLVDFMQLNQIVVEEEAMPQVEELHLRVCPELKMPPIGIKYLTCLQELTFKEMPEELFQELQNYYSQNQRELSHIPKFTCFD